VIVSSRFAAAADFLRRLDAGAEDVLWGPSIPPWSEVGVWRFASGWSLCAFVDCEEFDYVDKLAPPGGGYLDFEEWQEENVEATDADAELIREWAPTPTALALLGLPVVDPPATFGG
jgi:hypothetical protein